MRHLTFAWLQPGQVGRDTARQREFYREILERAAAEPTLAGAAYTSTVPPEEWGTRGAVFRGGEQPPRSGFAGHDFDYKVRSYMDVITPRLLDVMGIPIVRGRGFTEADDANAPAVVIVSRRLADELWPDQDPIGKTLAWPAEKGPERPVMRVVGVAADTRHAALTSDAPWVAYLPLAQHFSASGALMVRSRTGDGISGSVMQRVIGGVNPPQGTSLASYAGDQLQPQRRASAWIGAFGALALLLAAIGLYGIVAQSVLQRTRELAVRSAIGATPRAISKLIIAGGLRLTAMGVVIGAALSIAAVRVLRSQLAGVGGVDVLATLIAGAILGVVMLVAAWLPARRAARMNPIEALRAD
jgi:hypothetical protein